MYTVFCVFLGFFFKYLVAKGRFNFEIENGELFLAVTTVYFFGSGMRKNVRGELLGLFTGLMSVGISEVVFEGIFWLWSTFVVAVTYTYDDAAPT